MPKEPTSGQGGQQASSPAEAGQGAAQPSRSAPSDPAGRRQAARGRVIGERKKRYLVAPRQPLVQMGPLGMLPMAFQPLPLGAIEQALRAADDVDVLGMVGDRRIGGTLGDGNASAAGVLVARMTDRRAQELLMQGQGRLLVERDQHLQLFEPQLRQPHMVASLAPRPGEPLALTIQVADRDGNPVPDADVSLFGSLACDNAISGPDGIASLTLYGEQPDTIRGLYVEPKGGFWSFYQPDPDLSASEPNLVTLRPLSEWRGLSGFPAQPATGWGLRAMRINELPPDFRGRGVRIAVIDSGAATSHASLRHISQGIDLLGSADEAGRWNVDPLGHGSHAAGIIGAADPSFGVRGIAPEAELHVCKLLPGGQISQLIEALEYCIAHQIDVVNLGVGVAEPCEALEQQIARAKRFGVACVAAAGNSGDAVQYPASSPNVLAVAAIGKAGEFPPDSYHGETMNGDADAEGYFSARFSCYGPRVDVCAPGVAIVSTVPPNDFAAWDGTSAAAPHVTGLAALLLAHHPLFQGAGRVPNADRVDRLFQMIRMSARRVTVAPQLRIGYGLPDALTAFGWNAAVGERTGAGQSMVTMSQGFGPLGVPAGLAQAGGIAGLTGMPFGINVGLW
jgi:subtilisin family serine protease